VGVARPAAARATSLERAARRVGDEDLALVHREVTGLIHLARRTPAHLDRIRLGVRVGVRVRVKVRVKVKVRVHLARRAALTGSPSSSSVAPMCRRKRRLSRSKTETRLLPHSATSSSSPATRSRTRGGVVASGGAWWRVVACSGVQWQGQQRAKWPRRGVAWRGVARRGRGRA